MSKTLPEAILDLVPRRYATKKALAEAAGITETTLYNILGGKDVSGATLAKLKRAGVRVTPDVIDSLDSTG